MRKTTINLTKTRVNGEPYFCVTVPRPGKGRLRRFFKSRDEAKTFLDAKKIEKENHGTAAMALNESARSEYLECTEALKPYGATLRDAVGFYLPHLKARNRSCTAMALVDELLRVKTADGASERYLGDLRHRLRLFAQAFNGKPVAEITARELDEWLRALSRAGTGKLVAPTTRNNFRRVLRVAFNFARKQGYCASNPADSSAKAKEIERPVGILTPAETSRLLESCAPELVPFIAIGAFAGLRRAEIERLDWKEIDLASGLIQVTARKAKSARRRFVKVRENLASWLRPHAQQSGPVTPDNYRELLDTARAAARIHDWPQNALRHSFASYHLAQFKDAAALALELGHTNSNLVFQHYREVVKPKDAERFWGIKPLTADAIVAFA
ncbi:MAG: hypothetical protein QOD99_2029 [Chthoniobacter sp.]|jgi:integrase|nr:hypothetical protein [Chthoniobacter sp.]